MQPYKILLGKRFVRDIIICIVVGFFGGFCLAMAVMRIFGLLNDVVYHNN